MLQMSKHSETEFKKKIVRLRLGDAIFKNLAAKYDVSHAIISNCTNQFCNEYQTNKPKPIMTT